MRSLVCCAQGRSSPAHHGLGVDDLPSVQVTDLLIRQILVKILVLFQTAALHLACIFPVKDIYHVL